MCTLVLYTGCLTGFLNTYANTISSILMCMDVSKDQHMFNAKIKRILKNEKFGNVSEHIAQVKRK